MKSAFEADLVAALDALEAGMPVEEILSHYPEHAGQLRPILETGAQLSALPIAHSLSAQAVSRDAFLNQARALRKQERRVAPNTLWRRFAFSFASLAIFLVLLGGMLAGSAQAALPGQSLYPVKRAVEEVRLALASGPAGREALQAQFRAERREEIYALIAAGLEGRVECTGTIEIIADDSWTLDGLVVGIEPTTAISGDPQIGASAEGLCSVAEGRVVAERMRVEDGVELVPTPSATLTTTPTATPTTTSTPTATVTSTIIAPPRPTAAHTPVPTVQPGETEEEEVDDEEGDDEQESEREEDNSDDDAETEPSDDETNSDEDTDREEERDDDAADDDEPDDHDESDDEDSDDVDESDDDGSGGSDEDDDHES